MQSKPSLLLKYCSPAHNRPGSVIINSLWWNISALYFVLVQFILSYFFGGENGFGVIVLEASWVCLLESFSPGNEACLSWAPVCSHTNELLIRMMKLLGEVKPSNWPKRRLWINLYKAEGSSKTPVQHSGANETCMSATRGGRVCPAVFVERSKAGVCCSVAFSAFISTGDGWNWEYSAFCRRYSAVYSTQCCKAVCSSWIIFVHE